MSKLIKISRYGSSITEVKLYPRYYPHNRTLAVMLYVNGSRPREWYGALTCCLDDAPGKNRAYIDVNNMGEGILDSLEAAGFGKRTGRECRSGYVVYPEFEFNEKVLKECGGKEYAEYLKWQKELKEDEEYIRAACRICGKSSIFIIKKDAARKYREYEEGAGYLIQDIFPEMSPEDRGLLSRGQKMCGNCFKKMFEM